MELTQDSLDRFVQNYDNKSQENETIIVDENSEICSIKSEEDISGEKTDKVSLCRNSFSQCTSLGTFAQTSDKYFKI